MGQLVLAGGAEFTPGMAEVDRRIIEMAGGEGAALRIIPAAAAPDDNHARAGGNGQRWFKQLGLRDVEVVPIIDRTSADDTKHAEALRGAGIIYLLGGFPHHLQSSLSGSASWRAALEAHSEGAIIAGSSAGAMVLCEHYYDPYEKKLLRGLGLVKQACVLPHHARSGRHWAVDVRAQLPAATLIGIDEHTAILGSGESWTVLGKGMVTIYPPAGGSRLHHRGERLGW